MYMYLSTNAIRSPFSNYLFAVIGIRLLVTLIIQTLFERPCLISDIALILYISISFLIGRKISHQDLGLKFCQKFVMPKIWRKYSTV